MNTLERRRIGNADLRNAQARTWLRERSIIDPTDTGLARIIGDEVTDDGFALYRFWATSMSGMYPGRPVDSDAVDLWLVVEGTGRVEFGVITFEYAPGDLIVLPPVPTAISSPRPNAIIHLTTLRRRLALVDGRTIRPQVYPAGEPARVYLAIVTAMLNSGIDPDQPGFTSLRRGIDACMSAILEDLAVLTSDPSTTRSEPELYRAAISLMKNEIDNPTLTLDSVAARLNVSKFHLVHAFDNSGASPMRTLRRMRAVHARAMLDDTGRTRKTPSLRALDSEMREPCDTPSRKSCDNFEHNLFSRSQQFLVSMMGDDQQGGRLSSRGNNYRTPRSVVVLRARFLGGAAPFMCIAFAMSVPSSPTPSLLCTAIGEWQVRSVSPRPHQSRPGVWE